MVSTFSGSGSKPSLVIMWPRKDIDVCRRFNFPAFNRIPRSRHLCGSFLSFMSWSTVASSIVLPLPITRRPSALLITPSKSNTLLKRAFWNISGAGAILNGKTFHRNRPNGVVNVVKRLLASSNFTCQNPSRRSRVENTLLSASLGSRSSSVGNWKCSLFRDLFSGLGSMHIRRFPFFLTSSANALTHGVGSLTGSITFFFTSFSNLTFSLSLSILRAAATFGVTPESTSKCTSPGNRPNSSLNSLIMLSECWLMNSSTWKTLATILNFSLLTVMSAIFWIAFAPSKGWKSSFTMTNLTAYFCPVLGFIILTRHSPSSFTSALFHIPRVLFECSSVFPVTCFSLVCLLTLHCPAERQLAFLSLSFPLLSSLDLQH